MTLSLFMSSLSYTLLHCRAAGEPPERGRGVRATAEREELTFFFSCCASESHSHAVKAGSSGRSGEGAEGSNWGYNDLGIMLGASRAPFSQIPVLLVLLYLSHQFAKVLKLTGLMSTYP